MSVNSNDQSQTRIKSRFHNNPEKILLMDSNKKFFGEHFLYSDRNKRFKIIPCSDLSELKENIECLHEDLQILYIHTGVNDLDLKPVHEIHDDLLTIMGNIKRRTPTMRTYRYCTYIQVLMT